MCGIVGIAGGAALSAAQRASVRRMADSIVHRGPDDQGFFDDDSIVIGMRRLSIIDVEGGHQPIANEDRTVWAVCNGEIYNFRELRRELEQRGHRFRTHSDVEVTVHLYEEYGENFVDRLSGMFAIALWDSRQKKLVVVRDRLGIKPVYFCERDGLLAYASEVKALLQAPGVRAEIDPAGLRDHLTIGYSVAPHTVFKGIRKLPPATLLIWQAGEHRTVRYWSIPQQTRTDLGEDDWVALVREEFGKAVSSHMVSDVPIGAFLSGGIDSSAVVACMAAESAQPVNTYSIGYAGGGAARYYNELPYAGQVARQFRTNHHEIEVRPNVSMLLPKLIWHLEEPLSDSAIATTYLVAQLAAKSVKVILSGVGGDELFAGYNRYLGDHYGALYGKVPGWLRERVVEPLSARLPSGRQNRWMDLSRYTRSFVQAAALPWREQYKLFIALEEQAVLAALLGDASLQGPDGFDRILDGEDSNDPLLRLLRVDWQTQLGEDLLLLTDKMTMAESIECRVPFLDHRLVELAASIPASIKRPDGRLKSLLKKALEPDLPREILDRRKRGFGAPVGAWFKGELQPLRESLLSRKAIESRGWLAPRAVADICGAHDQNRHDYTDLILVFMNLEIWARLFLDGRSAEDVGEELSDSVTRSVASA
ncbi:MAG: asparagine synthase (glutamine-hydrolyzing) [Woeseia sp.]